MPSLLGFLSFKIMLHLSIHWTLKTEDLRRQAKDDQATIEDLRRQLQERDEQIAKLEDAIGKLSEKLDEATSKSTSEAEEQVKTITKFETRIVEFEKQTTILKEEKEQLFAEKIKAEREVIKAKEKNIASEGRHLTLILKKSQEVLAGRPRGAKGPNGKPLTMDDMIELVEELRARIKVLETCEADLKAGFYWQVMVF